MSYAKHMRQYKPYVITLVVVLLFFFLSRLIPQESLKNVIRQAGIFGPVVYILLMLTTYVVAPVTGTPLFIVGFYVFGQIFVLYITIAAIIASISNFWIARKWGRHLVERFIGKRNMEQMDKFTNNYGLVSLFFLRLFMGSMHDVISYAAGLTDIAFLPYFFISTIGIIPSQILKYYFASHIENPYLLTAVVFIELTISSLIFFLGSLVVKKYKTGKI